MERKTAFITGGAGYLGSHLAKRLKEQNWRVIIFDKQDIKKVYHPYFDRWHSGDILEYNRLECAILEEKVDVVFHLAGRIEVGASANEPVTFWNVNVAGTANVLRLMQHHNIKNIVFSSTAAVYRTKDNEIAENDLVLSKSVYGNTKIACEQMIKDSKFNYAIFRFFNLAGADPECKIGENHEPETHLIPQIFKNLNNFVINGNDFRTKDGTCVRDYVHVLDVVDALILGYEYIHNSNSLIMNLGSGKGHTVLDIINIIQNKFNVKVNYIYGPRRSGDSDILVADIYLARLILNYNPKYTIEDIVETAYKWHIKKEKEN